MREIARAVKLNLKAFYVYVSSKMSTKEGVANLIDKNGIQVKSDKFKAEALNNFFSSVFTEEKLEGFPYL